MNDKLYDVVIYHCKSGVVEAVIGEGLSEKNADKRQMTGFHRVNENYSVSIVDAGTCKKGDVNPACV